MDEEKAEVTMADLKETMRKTDNLANDIWYLSKGDLDAELVKKMEEGIALCQKSIRELIKNKEKNL